jgi:hypothetical protein
MINFKILNITTVATTICNLNILDVLSNMMNGNKQQLIKHVLVEHDEHANCSTPHVPFVYR